VQYTERFGLYIYKDSWRAYTACFSESVRYMITYVDFYTILNCFFQTTIS
jgi:hypothetical protein